MTIDIHSHFLPKLDDGAKSENESVMMLNDSKKQGVEVCVATPHIAIHHAKSITHFLFNREKSIECLKTKIRETKKEVPLLLLGAEIFLDNDISQYEDISKLCIENTRCLLVELSPLGYNPRYTEWIYSLTMKGYLPIIAHIERYPYIQELFRDLDGVDVVYQMNAKAILKRKWRSFLVSNYEINERKIVVASDMHNLSLRKCLLGKAREKLEKNHLAIAQEAFYEIPKKLLGI